MAKKGRNATNLLTHACPEKGYCEWALKGGVVYEYRSHGVSIVRKFCFFLKTLSWRADFVALKSLLTTGIDANICLYDMSKTYNTGAQKFNTLATINTFVRKFWLFLSKTHFLKMQQRYTRACPQETSYMCAVVPF
jgi:hypothetical protein